MAKQLERHYDEKAMEEWDKRSVKNEPSGELYTMIMNYISFANVFEEEYDDTFDITVHCNSKEEHDEVALMLRKYFREKPPGSVGIVWQPKWFPLSELQPEEKGYYLTTTMHHEVYCDYWNGINFDRTEAVIAWKFMPKPYETIGDCFSRKEEVSG